MKGYKKLILIILGSDLVLPTVLRNSPPLSGFNNAVDGNLASKTGKFGIIDQDEFVVDFGNVASRIPRIKFELNPENVIQEYRYDLDVSDDDISYSTVDTVTTASIGTYNLEGSQQNFRYLRILCTFISTGAFQPELAIFEMFDGLNLGGTANISFEILSEGKWIVLISSGTIGAITTGAALTKTIGDVINDGSSKFNFALPSTQTQFRIKLVITIGNLRTGVSIFRL